MKKNLLLTILLLATTLTFTACGKAEEATVEESTIVMEESTVEEETTEETETVEEESTEEETLSMTEEEIRAFLEEVKDMDYESYTYHHTQYYTECISADGNPYSDNTYEDFYYHLDSDNNILYELLTATAEHNNLVEGETHHKRYFMADGSYADNNIDVDTTSDWSLYKKEVVYPWIECAPFFGGYTELSVADIASKTVITEYNGRPALYIDNLTDDTEESFLEYLYSDADTLTATEGSLVYDIYLYLDVPGEYTSAESVRYTDKEGETCTVHDVYELSKVNTTELPEIPENFIKY